MRGFDDTHTPQEGEKQERVEFWTRMGKSLEVVPGSLAIKVMAPLAHLLCLFAPFCFSWDAVGVAFGLYIITGLGVTLSYHRNLSHRSYKLPKWLEYFFAYCGVHALQVVRIVFVNHVTYFVNSACHQWGNRAWNTSDLSTNNWLIALLAFGEGWHNNHHAFEFSARHGLEWYQLDITWSIVWALQAVGLATDVKLPTNAQKRKMAFKNRSMETIENMQSLK
nr:palmitoyl-monogalactosyldiacylglycerol delta-7 desaturase, chloroplastic-like isoform X2 [Ipomoea trifida]